jgi:hypothetical protein
VLKSSCLPVGQSCLTLARPARLEVGSAVRRWPIAVACEDGRASVGYRKGEPHGSSGSPTGSPQRRASAAAAAAAAVAVRGAEGGGPAGRVVGEDRPAAVPSGRQRRGVEAQAPAREVLRGQHRLVTV